jgi:protease-4
MIDGRTRRAPLIGAQVSGSYTIAEAVALARESPLVKAVVVRVESPGGSSTAADVIWRQVQLTARVKPVIVSMGGYAASGGYYISAPAARIFANPSTLTGSIGVYYAKADASQLLDRIGVDIEVYKTTEQADAESLYRPFTEGERQQLERSLRQFYDVFLERVASGRKLAKQAVDEVAQGRVWTGEQALQHGLVDEVGGLRQALEYARSAASLPEQAPIIELPKIPTSWLGRVLGIPGITGSSEAPLDALLPPALRDVGASLVPFLMYSSHVPLMRLDFIPVPP